MFSAITRKLLTSLMQNVRMKLCKLICKLAANYLVWCPTYPKPYPCRVSGTVVLEITFYGKHNQYCWIKLRIILATSISIKIIINMSIVGLEYWFLGWKFVLYTNLKYLLENSQKNLLLYINCLKMINIMIFYHYLLV